MKKYLTILVMLFSLLISASTVSTINDTKWYQTSTWDNTIPGCYDTIIINNDILLDNQVDLSSCGPIVFIINGELEFKAGKKLKLPVGSELFINTGGSVVGNGGGTSNLIDIGSSTVWTSAVGTITGPDYTNGSTQLPVSFLGMNYDCSRKMLSWETSTELNNDYFTIIVGNKFNNKILVPIESIFVDGSGNTNEITEYLLNLNINENYVEISQTDFDGTSKNLGILYVSCPSNKSFIIAPNPGYENYGVKILGDFKIVQIYDITGKEVYAHIIENKITGLSSGLYIIIIDNRYTFRIIIKK